MGLAVSFFPLQHKFFGVVRRDQKKLAAKRLTSKTASGVVNESYIFEII